MTAADQSQREDDPPPQGRQRVRSQPSRARRHLVVAAVVGVVAGVAAATAGARGLVLLAGWDAAVLTYLGLVWWTVHGADAARTAALAVPEEPDRASSDGLLLVAAVVSLGAVAMVLMTGHHEQGAAKVLDPAAAVTSVVLSWFLVHVVHLLTYARLYYSDEDGGVGFNDDQPPSYADFAYLAFTIGTTFQVSDTDLRSRTFRSVVLKHALLSYLFGTVVIATVVNLVVSLGSGGG